VADVLVDTSIWSLALRHRISIKEDLIVQELKDVIRETRARIIGPIRQEILSGIRDQKQFDLLKTRLRAFPDLHLHEDVFERAAQIFNACRKVGIQGSNTDFLISAAAEQNGLAIFTTDQDFHRYQKYCKFILHEPRNK
jgi:predicted nucleic acid-binding protein